MNNPKKILKIATLETSIDLNTSLCTYFIIGFGWYTPKIQFSDIAFLESKRFS